MIAHFVEPLHFTYASVPAVSCKTYSRDESLCLRSWQFRRSCTLWLPVGADGSSRRSRYTLQYTVQR